ncbi:MsnO8 family LLM class oxidoreductase [Nocardioides sp. cx-169]|uniref:MsnO8 family LLM class oxidoreductase n=1 Tax=Nocardioides sp. cx-169 TaxID=2899080 RepID=UPI001E6418C6|nr:MsnO8 family LLM class oxidoreductase [Nocardioides sp. cx-169]MCD4532572.1 MsnO8 family LLM class oxidoreductase [Nocardioides sp. cx-169]
MRLSLLDRSRTRAGRPDAEGLTGTIQRARHAESVGFERFWVAEHHAVPGIASGSPPVLLAALGARTSTIRIGSGGVMLPHHQPFVVAEQFRVLEALFPGRVDLGLGRSLGFTAPVRRALRHGAEEPDTFEADLTELREYLEGAAAVTVRPVTPATPMHLLATGRGLQVAARLGLPVVVGGPILDDPEVGERLAGYRRDFRPHRGSTASVTVSLDVTVADDDASAVELALPEAWAMARSRQTGKFPPLEAPEAIRAHPWPDQVRRRVDSALDRAVAGDPATVRRALERLVERTGADELMASTSTYDREALLASDAALRAIVS